jgi:hypothetical protein
MRWICIAFAIDVDVHFTIVVVFKNNKNQRTKIKRTRQRTKQQKKNCDPYERQALYVFSLGRQALYVEFIIDILLLP